MKKLVREFEFSPEQLHTVRALARELDLTETTASILVARGVDTPQKAHAFLHPSEKNYLSPFLMSGMREAVALIETAREESWRVAVFGDYDADGIGACAVLSRALAMFGIEPYLFVPERTDGYGLSMSVIDGIFDEFLPDLIITVDCGISNKREVEYIQSLGAYVIVTDHHELPEELPDCIVINPKLKDDYPYDNLCGAGVAFKLAQALIGKRANDLVDFAALSTVADSVPLLGENRDIVAEGLRRIERSPRPCFASLIGKSSEITAQTLAFTVAPRVNAAGRMGDAKAALRLFTSEDEREIYDLAVKLNAYNLERQKCCDELYAQACANIAAEGAYGNVVVLAGENWNAGFVGIVAARIAEEFSRPTLLFVRRGGTLKGSARSIENINIFEALKSCSQYITEFGGHAQAAGASVSEEHFESLKKALNEYIGANHVREDFVPTVYVVGEGTEDFRRVAREVALLEPCGMGNRRPLFFVEAGAVNASPLKPGSPHLSLELGGFEFVYFGGAKDLGILRSDLKKQLIFEYNVSHFRGKEYVKGFVRNVLYDGASGTDIELDALENRLRLAAVAHAEAERMEEAELNELIGARIKECAYGLCAVVAERSSLTRFPALAGVGVDVFRPSSGSCANTVVYAPAGDCDLSAFREVILLDSPDLRPVTGSARLIANASYADMGAIQRIDCSRETLLSIFAALRRYDGVETGSSYADAARVLALCEYSLEQVVFALAVFEELGLITLAEGRLKIVRGKKTELSNSVIYNTVSRIKERG
ncbi:MAG: single-stranded-DNA-specific exonuclease RecJ [Clostridia bacterium]|nr:single-stranded-DNA-specific exonuclease RecJ [Clostridia bacterium]